MSRIHKATRFGVGVVLLLILSAPVTAQQPWPVTVEVNLGYSAGNTSGEFRDGGGGIAADMLLGYRFKSAARSGWVLATSAGLQGKTVHTSDCVPAPDGGCVPWFPLFGIVSVLGGWEMSNTRLRVLAGPALALADGDASGAALARVEAALLVAGRTALIASMRAAFVPRYRGDSFQLLSGGIGLRVR